MIPTEVKMCAKDRAEQQKKCGPVVLVTANIQEIRPLEDRPRRLFVENAVHTAGDVGSLDGFLDGILNLQGFI